MRIFDRYLIMRTIRCMLVIAGLLCLQFADAEESNLGSQPSGLIISDQQVVSGDQYVVFEAIEEPVSNVVAAPAYIQEPVLAVDSNKKEEEPEPSLQPMVIAGSAATLAATGVAVAAVFASPVLFWGALILFAAGTKFLSRSSDQSAPSNPRIISSIDIIDEAASFVLNLNDAIL